MAPPHERLQRLHVGKNTSIGRRRAPRRPTAGRRRVHVEAGEPEAEPHRLLAPLQPRQAGEPVVVEIREEHSGALGRHARRGAALVHALVDARRNERGVDAEMREHPRERPPAACAQLFVGDDQETFRREPLAVGRERLPVEADPDHAVELVGFVIPWPEYRFVERGRSASASTSHPPVADRPFDRVADHDDESCLGRAGVNALRHRLDIHAPTPGADHETGVDDPEPGVGRRPGEQLRQPHRRVAFSVHAEGRGVSRHRELWVFAEDDRQRGGAALLRAEAEEVDGVGAQGHARVSGCERENPPTGGSR